MGVGGDRDFLTLSGEMCLSSLNQRCLSPKESHWILLKMQIPRASPKDSESGGQVPESVMGPISTETAERVEKHGRGPRRSCVTHTRNHTQGLDLISAPLSSAGHSPES